jgi:hypothetical protein
MRCHNSVVNHPQALSRGDRLAPGASGTIQGEIAQFFLEVRENQKKSPAQQEEDVSVFFTPSARQSPARQMRRQNPAMNQ